jgi:hypothetical protein
MAETVVVLEIEDIDLEPTQEREELQEIEAAAAAVVPVYPKGHPRVHTHEVSDFSEIGIRKWI